MVENSGRKACEKSTKGAYKAQARSRITNGTDLLIGIDHRSGWVRRFRDVLALHLSDLGGHDQVSHAEMALVRRAACISVECEVLEAKFASNNGAKSWELKNYQRASNTLRRLLETLGLKRRMKTVTPTLDQYLASKTVDVEAAP